VNVSDYGYKEALTLLVKTIRETYPLAEVVLCTLNVFKRVVYDHFPTRNGTNTLPEFNNAIREVANQMGCRLIEFDKDGITFENAYPTYISDSATIPTHPNATGHSKMAEKAIIDLS
jgi:lysophospholipase L1-like esterase